ncbi:Dolichyl-phosphate-mannose-protein mannosyltransferase [uncultured archaeon]|nr:Dolichyl-phosphate-mannose-protein mannosyltransferase [uncultured archaeon]
MLLEKIWKNIKMKTIVLPLKSKISIILLLFLTICGFLLRIYHLGSPSFWIDEAISANAAAALIKHGTPTFPSGFIYMRAILNTFFISLSFLVFGISEFSARFPSVIFGTLTIPLVYIMGVKFGNRKIGLIAAFLITFSVMEIAWSRQARMYQQLQLFYLSSLYFFFEFNFCDQERKNTSKRILNFALSVLFLISAVLSHEFGYVLILIFVPFYLIANFKKIKYKWKDFTYMKYYIGSFIFIVVLIFLFLKFMGSDFFSVISFISKDSWLPRVTYFEVYFNILETELSFFIYLAIFGAVLALRKSWMSGLLLIIGFVIPFYILSYYVLLPGTRYLYFIFPILLIFCSYFFDFLFEFTQRHSENKPAKTGLTFIAIVITSMLIIMAFSQHVFMILPDENFDLGVNAPQADFKGAYSYVRENMQNNDVLIDSRPAVSLFYMGRSDYWLAFEANGVGLGIDNLLVNNGSNEVYANAVVIKNVDMLKEVVAKNDRGWIVLDNSAWILISSDIKAYIIEELHDEASDGTIRIYSWGIKK